MDGVLWRGSQALPGMPRFFETVRRLGIRLILATNNASKSGAEYLAKLRGLGVSVTLDEVLTAPQATAAYLARHAPEARVFVIGEPGLVAELRAKGLQVVNEQPEQATHVVVGWDRALTYDKLAEACLLIRRGAVFIGTNPDVTYPSERGIVPGNGATLAALRVSTGVEPLIIGKPQPEMMRQAMARMGGSPENTAVVGDRLDTDILGGRNAGLTTILVLTGVTSLDEARDSAIRPDYIFQDIGAVADALQQANT
ncbi:MAG: acid sugar phosphatase [Candidatus Roseilinea sp.]|nr:MAG: acid sugar phosphatase [Candidatus Roseilinea sp.]